MFVEKPKWCNLEVQRKTEILDDARWHSTLIGQVDIVPKYQHSALDSLLDSTYSTSCKTGGVCVEL